MVNLKKKLSVTFAKALEPVLRKHIGFYDIAQDDTSGLLVLKDKDKSSDFIFVITKEAVSQNSHSIHFSCKPFSRKSVSHNNSALNLEGFIKKLDEWFENLQFYEEPSVLNDPLLRQYWEEFYSDFKIDDEHADFESFDYPQQLALSKYLDVVITEIQQLRTDENDDQVTDLIHEVEVLKTQVTVETKNGFLSKYTLLLASARKKSLVFCDLMLHGFFLSFVSEGGKGVFNYLYSKTLNYFTQLPEGGGGW